MAARSRTVVYADHPGSLAQCPMRALPGAAPSVALRVGAQRKREGGVRDLTFTFTFATRTCLARYARVAWLDIDIHAWHVIATDDEYIVKGCSL